MRNCDGFTNENLIRPGIGLMKICPNAISYEASTAFRWWADFHRWEGRVLPIPGLDFYAQPNPIVQAIFAGESEYQKAVDSK